MPNPFEIYGTSQQCKLLPATRHFIEMEFLLIKLHFENPREVCHTNEIIKNESLLEANNSFMMSQSLIGPFFVFEFCCFECSENRASSYSYLKTNNAAEHNAALDRRELRSQQLPLSRGGSNHSRTPPESPWGSGNK